jgi:hypothetical protein
MPVNDLEMPRINTVNPMPTAAIFLTRLHMAYRHSFHTLTEKNSDMIKPVFSPSPISEMIRLQKIAGIDRNASRIECLAWADHLFTPSN